MAFNPNEMDDSLRRARTAQAEWAKKPLAERLAPVARLRARLAAEPKVLAEVVAAEIGKSRWEAVAAEVLPTAETCAFLLDRAPHLLAPRPERLRGLMPFAGKAFVRHVPWGVVASLVPWNYPLFLCAGPALSALVAGNAIAMKASPRAKRTVQAFGEWLWEAGFPRDLAPVLDSSDDAGRALSGSPLIDRIVFTGSSKTGRSVLHAAAENLVPATIELSGYDAVYVLRDANVTLAAAAVAFGMRMNAGRTCICPRRVFVEQPVAEAFKSLLGERLTRKKLVCPMDPQTLMEADALAATLAALPNVVSLNGRKAGDAETAILVSGGVEALDAAKGNFVPAAVVATVADVDEAVALDSASNYGLGASVFTRDRATAEALAGRMRAGIIAVNECIMPAGEAALPFGGAKESGYGVRAGEEGLMEMTRPQAIAFSEGTYRPHHDAEGEAENLVMALLRARHSGTFFGRLKGWMDAAVEGIKWRPPK